MENALEVASAGLRAGVGPALTVDGTGGTYILKDPFGAPVGVFKPLCEEPYAPYNPRGLSGPLGSPTLRPGLVSGSAGYREVCASLLEPSLVPECILVDSLHKEYSGHAVSTGSFSVYKANIGCAEDFSESKFSKEQVQRVGLLDLRILNMDRNVTNLLVSSEFALIPIDHGLSAPECLQIEADDLCWMKWPQAKEPFTSKCIELAEALEPLNGIFLLSERLGLSDESLKNLRMVGELVKKAARRGLTLFDLGTLVYRKSGQQPSVLETIDFQAKRLYFASKQDTAALRTQKALQGPRTRVHSASGLSRVPSTSAPRARATHFSSHALAFNTEFFQYVDTLLEHAVQSAGPRARPCTAS